MNTTTNKLSVGQRALVGINWIKNRYGWPTLNSAKWGIA